MAENVYSMMWLLLLSLTRTGVTGKYGLIFAERSSKITFPCAKDFICFHVWAFSTKKASNYIAIVTNGAIQTPRSQDDDSKCTLQIKDLKVGLSYCQQGPVVSSPHNISSAAPELNLMPGETVPLQCILFTCNVKQHKQFSLTWVDETGARIQEDSQNQIKQQTACHITLNVTLNVTLQSHENKMFRCQVTVDKQVQTSVELRVRVPGRERGRGFIGDQELEPQDHNQGTTGAAVGVVGCAILMVLVTALVVSRRKARKLPNESPNTIYSTDVMNANDVIYADIILPAGSDRLWVQECESTEYACVKYK